MVTKTIKLKKYMKRMMNTFIGIENHQKRDQIYKNFGYKLYFDIKFYYKNIFL